MDGEEAEKGFNAAEEVNNEQAEGRPNQGGFFGARNLDDLFQSAWHGSPFDDKAIAIIDRFNQEHSDTTRGQYSRGKTSFPLESRLSRREKAAFFIVYAFSCI